MVKNHAPVRSRRWASPVTFRPSRVTSPGPMPEKQTLADHAVATSLPS